jgi:hypothetical protein
LGLRSRVETGAIQAAEAAGVGDAAGLDVESDPTVVQVDRGAAQVHDADYDVARGRDVFVRAARIWSAALALPETEETALSAAIENVQVAVVEFLLARGANPNQPGYFAQTPLQRAFDSVMEAAIFESDKSGRFVPADLMLVSVLLAAGADPRQTNAKGESALDWAKHRRNEEAVQLMLGTSPR